MLQEVILSEETLEKWRLEIDEIDKQILLLIAERLKIVQRIKDWKKINGKEIVDTHREAEVLTSILHLAAELNLDLIVVSRIFCEIIQLSRQLQKG